MQGWVVAGAWLFALLVALVVLGFAVYELSWKSRRLLAERDRLNRLIAELRSVSGDLHRIADRAHATAQRRHPAAPAEPFVS
jgi:cell division protein FtsL